MRAFMTTGTAHFLKNVTDSHPTIHFYFMKSGVSTLVYYESEKKKSIFVSGRSYDILANYGFMNKTGFVVMDSVPVMEDGMAVFEERFNKQLPTIQHAKGILAARLLKQVKGNTYIIFTQWETERHYTDWQKSSAYEQLTFSKLARLPAYFAERPFTSTYYMLKEDD